MTSREIFRKIFKNEQPERMPYLFGGPRASTFSAWRKQGLSKEQEEKWTDFVGEDDFVTIGKVDFGLVPVFEERIIRKTGFLKSTLIFLHHSEN